MVSKLGKGPITEGLNIKHGFSQGVTDRSAFEMALTAVLRIYLTRTTKKLG